MQTQKIQDAIRCVLSIGIQYLQFKRVDIQLLGTNMLMNCILMYCIVYTLLCTAKFGNFLTSWIVLKIMR